MKSRASQFRAKTKYLYMAIDHDEKNNLCAFYESRITTISELSVMLPKEYKNPLEMIIKLYIYEVPDNKIQMDTNAFFNKVRERTTMEEWDFKSYLPGQGFLLIGTIENGKP